MPSGSVTWSDRRPPSGSLTGSLRRATSRAFKCSDQLVQILDQETDLVDAVDELASRDLGRRFSERRGVGDLDELEQRARALEEGDLDAARRHARLAAHFETKHPGVPVGAALDVSNRDREEERRGLDRRYLGFLRNGRAYEGGGQQRDQSEPSSRVADGLASTKREGSRN